MYHCFPPEWLLIPLIFTTSPLPVLLLPLNCCHITYPCISATSQLLPLLTASHLNDYYLMANVLQLPSLTYMYDHLIASALLLPTSHANITSSCLTTTSHLPYLTIATSKLPVLLLPHTYHTIATTSQLHVLLLPSTYHLSCASYYCCHITSSCRIDNPVLLRPQSVTYHIFLSCC